MKPGDRVLCWAGDMATVIQIDGNDVKVCIDRTGESWVHLSQVQTMEQIGVSEARAKFRKGSG